MFVLLGGTPKISHKILVKATDVYWKVTSSGISHVVQCKFLSFFKSIQTKAI